MGEIFLVPLIKIKSINCFFSVSLTANDKLLSQSVKTGQNKPIDKLNYPQSKCIVNI